MAEEHPSSMAPGAAQRAEQGGPIPGSGQASFIETGARELRQLYPDASEDMCRLLCQHRLVLVLDLDHTLVNSARQNEVDAEHLQVAISLLHKLVILHGCLDLSPLCNITPPPHSTRRDLCSQMPLLS